MKASLKAEVKYFPYEMPKLWKCRNLCYDEIKMNLVWLVCPEIDTLIHTAWPGNVVTESVDAHMSHDLRAILNGPPLAFMRDFSGMPGPLVMTEDWPNDYVTTMWERAREANARLCIGLEPNVLKVDFKNRRRYG